MQYSRDPRRSFARAVLWLSLFLLLCGSSFATSIVMLITHDGIAIGADEKITHGAGSSAPPTSRQKITIIDNRIAVARSGIETLGMRGSEPVWSFDAFIRRMQAQTTPQMTVAAFAEHLRAGLIQAFSRFDVALKARAVTPQMLGAGGKVFLKLFVTGFEGESPRAYSLEVAIDWTHMTHTVPPVQSLYPDGRKNLSILWSSWSATRGLVELRDHSSPVHHDFKKQMPEELEALENDRQIPWIEIPPLVRNLLKVEVARNPEGVGFPLQVVTIPKEGKPSQATYDR